MLEILFKRTSSGSIQIWKIKVVEYTIGIKFGQFNGKLQYIRDDIYDGKQKRTPQEQALFQAKALVKSQKDKGYKSLEDLGIKAVQDPGWTGDRYETFKGWMDLEEALKEFLPKNAIGVNGAILPMLSQPICKEHTKNGVVTKIDYWHKVVYPVAGEPKLDGVRCLKRTKQHPIMNDIVVTSTSRKGMSYDFGTSKLRQKLYKLFAENPDIVLDGELYIHGELQNKISGAMRKGTYIPEIHDQMQYHVWDIVDTELTYEQRKEILIQLLEKYEAFDLVLPRILHNREEVNAYNIECIEAGYEGIMLKTLDGKYEIDRRSWGSFKVKEQFEEEFEIIGYELGKRGAEDIVFIMKTNEGVEFKAKPMGDKKLKEQYHLAFTTDTISRGFAKQYIIGKMATVKFKFWSHNGKPSHSQVKDIRDYE